VHTPSGSPLDPFAVLGERPDRASSVGQSWRPSPSGNGGEPNTKRLWKLLRQPGLQVIAEGLLSYDVGMRQ
jgi:hypothetical protein